MCQTQQCSKRRVEDVPSPLLMVSRRTLTPVISAPITTNWRRFQLGLLHTAVIFADSVRWEKCTDACIELASCSRRIQTPHIRTYIQLQARLWETSSARWVV